LTENHFVAPALSFVRAADTSSRLPSV